MATFVVCSRCGNVQETKVLDQVPEDWRRSLASLYCPHCTEMRPSAFEADGDVLDEQVIVPPADSSDIDESFGDCETCRGPCQGH